MGQYRDLVIFDPAAAGADRDEVREILADMLPHSTFRGIVAGENIQPDVERAIISGYDRIIAAGGDAIVAAVAAAMLYSGMPLGVLPLGPRNVLATQLGLPHIPLEACELLAQGGAMREVSAMSVNGRIAVTPVEIGSVSRGRLGWGRSWRMRLSVDGALHKTSASLLVAELDRQNADRDGKLLLSIHRLRSPGEAFRAGGRMFVLKPPFPERLERFEVVREIRLESESPIPIRGAVPLGSSRSIAIENLPGALRVVVPSPAGSAPASLPPNDRMA